MNSISEVRLRDFLIKTPKNKLVSWSSYSKSQKYT